MSLANPGQYLTFVLKGQNYGVPIGMVREINRMTEITPVPHVASFVAGVINLRGKVIPVVNLRMKFGLEFAQASKDTCIVVIEAPGGQVGIVVDAVNSVIEMSAAQIEPAPRLGGGADSTFLLGMAKLEASVVILLDLVSALSGVELSMGASAVA